MGIMPGAYGLRATLIAGQLPIEHWHEYMAQSKSSYHQVPNK
jgi:hypothetical protein